ncbi:MAG: transglycosylase domain-containing protein, partial [Acidobacteriota bacterium]
INQEREKRKNIEFRDLPKTLIDAIVSTEDRTFFDHSGISLRGIARAFTRNYEAGEITEGGSTITQQLVKSFFLTPERTWKRKISEAYMAIILERKLSKEQILAMYCNQIYLGQRGGFSINGFGEAARSYFNKDVSYLTLSESALLAGIVQSPNFYSPYSHEKRALDRRATVLDLMLEQGKIKPEEAANAKAQSLGVIGKGGTDATDAPYFVDYVLRQLDAQYGEDSQSLRSMRVYTSVDLELQRAAYAAVQKNLPEIDRQVLAKRGTTAGLQIALVAMNAKTGDILAMVGGRDYANSQLNRAADARRQPGSVFKPFVYAAGLSESDASRRITAASMFRDEPRSFEYDGKYYAPDNFRDSYELRTMTAREALAKSKNVITVAIAERVGFTQVAAFAERAGLQKVLAVPATALGTAEATPLQMASAYTAFANQGKRAAPVAVTAGK